MLKVSSQKGTVDYSMGRVKLLNPNINIGIVNMDSIAFFDPTNQIIYLNKNYFSIEERIQNYPCSIKVLLGDTPILNGKIGAGSLRFYPLGARYAVIRARGDKMPDVDNLSDSGMIYLCLMTEKGDLSRIPVAQWIKKPVAITGKGEISLKR